MLAVHLFNGINFDYHFLIIRCLFYPKIFKNKKSYEAFKILGSKHCARKREQIMFDNM